ncbi:unnamed protein product [Trichogramma brassicae]|uniref:Uncharacterized protein n=1 Tax=Trichogramma brassicae TaxID=86971 RepID=A0A6H5IAC9_9HYME|nr:unnamed protein product [Trichogramma brassicae]
MCCIFVPVQPELKSNMDIDLFLKNSEWTEDPFQSQKFTKNIFNYEWQLEESRVINHYACYENNKNTLKSDKVGDSSGNDDNDDDTKVKLVRPKMFIGTEDGRHLYVTWQGFHTDVINSQHCKIVYEYPEEKPDKPMPVTHAIRSPFFHDILLTINGENVYVWRVDNPLPCFEYKNEMNPNITYTSGCWDRRDASVILLGTSNGDIEILDLKIQQDILNCSIPKQIKWKKIVNTVIRDDITGLYPHAIPLQPLVVVVSDVKGGLKIYKAKGKKYRVLKEIVDYGTRNERILRELEINNKEWLREFINGRTSDRIKSVSGERATGQQRAATATTVRGTTAAASSSAPSSSSQADELNIRGAKFSAISAFTRVFYFIYIPLPCRAGAGIRIAKRAAPARELFDARCELVCSSSGSGSELARRPVSLYIIVHIVEQQQRW